VAPVTVVIPVRDRADLLRATLRTVAEQTAPPAEVIVADDGSRDGSAEVAAALGARVLRREAGGWGAAGARNAGLAEARGERVLFLDSDDLLLPTALASLGAALDAAPGAPFAYGRALAAVRAADGWRSEGLIAARPRELADPLALFVRNAVPSPAALVRTEAARAAGGYDASLPFSEDHDFFIRLALTGAPAHVPAVVAVHRRHPDNRHRAFAALESDLRISGLAERDARLRARLPERSGTQLAEIALEAGRRRRPDVLLRHGVPLLLRSGSVGRTLRASGGHLRARRAWARAGEATWSADAELRAWLAER
jgi:glycosyltransferase involved in cell wall biosynthesis